MCTHTQTTHIDLSDRHDGSLSKKVFAKGDNNIVRTETPIVAKKGRPIGDWGIGGGCIFAARRMDLVPVKELLSSELWKYDIVRKAYQIRLGDPEWSPKTLVWLQYLLWGEKKN